MVERFEKIGAVIFGTQRLDGALDALSAWFVSTSAERGASIDAALPRARIADLYFGGHAHLDKEKAALCSFFDAVSAMESETADLRSHDDAAIDAWRERLKVLHFSLADLFQQIGYAEYPPEKLRQQGRRLSA
ncbi:MAG TPA: hypothetical protein VF800_21840 [Telluria sp.]|jgi:hypothetical protein